VTEPLDTGPPETGPPETGPPETGPPETGPRPTPSAPPPSVTPEPAGPPPPTPWSEATARDIVRDRRREWRLVLYLVGALALAGLIVLVRHLTGS
jgi:hypothetical protein